ncbi:MAG: 2OG-Fe(II) oxygenase [Pseudomonadota bacterium]
MGGFLNLDAIASAKMYDRPYRWGHIPQAFSSDTAARTLADSFPRIGFNHYTRHSTAKEYDTYGRFLVRMGHGAVFDEVAQPEPWRALASELLSNDYVEAVEEASGVTLKTAHIEVAFWRLTEGCTIGPHTDNPLKRVSHLFYFNSSWSQAQGGYLRILNSWKMDDVAAEIPPLLGTSLIIVRSRDSWHGYAPVRGDTPRLAIQVSFCECAAT